MSSELAFPIRRMKIREGDPPKLMARAVGPSNTPVTQATFGSIAWKLFDLNADDPTTVADSGTLTVATYVYDSLQTSANDAAWTEDETGYNFAWQVPSSKFLAAAAGPGKFRMEIRGTPSSGEAFWIGIWVIEVYDVLTDLSA